jgi:hypothetical protein
MTVMRTVAIDLETCRAFPRKPLPLFIAQSIDGINQNSPPSRDVAYDQRHGDKSNEAVPIGKEIADAETFRRDSCPRDGAWCFEQGKLYI